MYHRYVRDKVLPRRYYVNCMHVFALKVASLYIAVFVAGGHNGSEHLSAVEVLDVGHQVPSTCLYTCLTGTFIQLTARRGYLYAS